MYTVYTPSSFPGVNIPIKKDPSSKPPPDGPEMNIPSVKTFGEPQKNRDLCRGEAMFTQHFSSVATGPRRLPRLGRRSERPVSQGRSRNFSYLTTRKMVIFHGDLISDLMVIFNGDFPWFINGLTMVNNGMIWELPSGYD